MIRGTDRILRTAAEWLRLTIDRRISEVRVGFVTVNEGFSDYKREWLDLRECWIELRRRRTAVYSLWAPDHNPFNQFQLPHELLGLEPLSSGSETPHFVAVVDHDVAQEGLIIFDRDGVPCVPLHGLLIVGNDALLVLGSDLRRDPDSALIVSDQRQVALLQRHFDYLHDRAVNFEVESLHEEDVRSFLRAGRTDTTRRYSGWRTPNGDTRRLRVPELVNNFETTCVRNYRAITSCCGGLIQTAVGSAGGSGMARTKRSGWAL